MAPENFTRPCQLDFSVSLCTRLLSVQRNGAKRLEKFRVLAKVGEETQQEDNSGATDESKSVKGKGFGAPKPVVEKKKSSAPSSNVRRTPPQKPLLAAQVDEKTKQFETITVTALAFVFALIIVEGVALAASGFLPEEWDEFLLKVIYPIFTPTVGVFLAGAAGYGVWKFFGLGENK
ncbi:hypothetical protein R1flu_021191 [Riccia fluitans]|uniref:Uncharacterized protein n=1 Tax=Riccia fluitans TaxID=41844 RepID=A0ABD1ZNN4_9MARC